MKITKMMEKPTAAVASSSLVTPSLPPDKFLSFFGIYALKPHIFSVLKAKIEENAKSPQGYFNLTEALKEINKHNTVNAFEIEGVRYDLTDPVKYAEAVSIFARR